MDCRGRHAFTCVTALPKVGKSTLLLALFAELGKRTGSFLNFSISTEKKYEIFLVGPDMNRNLWDKAGRESGLLEHIALGESKWQAIVRDVWAEEDRVGLTPEFIKTLTAKAKESIARGAHPIRFSTATKSSCSSLVMTATPAAPSSPNACKPAA